MSPVQSLEMCSRSPHAWSATPRPVTLGAIHVWRLHWGRDATPKECWCGFSTEVQMDGVSKTAKMVAGIISGWSLGAAHWTRELARTLGPSKNCGMNWGSGKISFSNFLAQIWVPSCWKTAELFPWWWQHLDVNFYPLKVGLDRKEKMPGMGDYYARAVQRAKCVGHIFPTSGGKADLTNGRG